VDTGDSSPVCRCPYPPITVTLAWVWGISIRWGSMEQVWEQGTKLALGLPVVGVSVLPGHDRDIPRT
jgi:hypothetical protein